jgi:predicted DNA-binding WGR domain protein
MAIRLSRVDPAKNMARFYELDIQSGLFGDVCVVRHWGRIGSNGQGKEHWLESDAKAIELTSKLERQKRQRGYGGPLPSPKCTKS